MRSGTTWDVLAVVALVAPLAGLVAPLAGASGRRSMVRAGRWGALAGLAGWAVLLGAGAAPEVGTLAPDGLAMASAAGAALLAAVVTLDPPTGQRPTVTTAFAAPLAALVGSAAGAVDPPDDLGRVAATLLVVLGAVLAAGAVGLAVGGRRVGLPLAVVLVSPALLVSLRGSAALVDPVAAAGFAALAAAAAVAALAARRPTGHGPIAAAGGLLVAALALAPVAAVRPWAALLAGGVVVVTTGAGRWAVLGLAPGLVGTAVALADVPAAGDPAVLGHVAYAVGLAAFVLAVVLAVVPVGPAVGAPAGGHGDDDADDDAWDDAVLDEAWAADEPEGPASAPFPIEVRAAVAVVGGWLVLAPGSWRWAVADATVLEAWDRAAAVAVAVAGATAVAVFGLRLLGADRGRERAAR